MWSLLCLLFAVIWENEALRCRIASDGWDLSQLECLSVSENASVKSPSPPADRRWQLFGYKNVINFGSFTLNQRKARRLTEPLRWATAPSWWSVTKWTETSDTSLVSALSPRTCRSSVSPTARSSWTSSRWRSWEPRGTEILSWL